MKINLEIKNILPTFAVTKEHYNDKSEDEKRHPCVGCDR